MQKWEYLTFNPSTEIIYCSEANIDDLVNAIKHSLPQAKIDVRDKARIFISKTYFMDVANCLGNEGWEFVSDSRRRDTEWLFKRPKL